MAETASAPVNVSPATAASSEISESESLEAAPVEGTPEVAASPDAAKLQELQNKPNPTAAEKKLLKKLQIKVDGASEDVELPFEIEDKPEIVDWMKKQLQLSKVSSKRMNEYSQLEKEVRTFVDELKKNPRKVLSDPNINIDLKKLASEMIEEEIANSQKSPEQLKAEKLEAELKQMKEDREKEQKELQAREFERMQEQAYERYDLQMTKALEGSDLPKSPYVVKKMADYMMLALQNNIDASPEDVLPLVRQEILDDVKAMFSVMPEEVIEGIVGKETINKIRKKSIAKAKQAPPTPVNKAVPDTGAKAAPKADAAQKKSFREYFGV